MEQLPLSPREIDVLSMASKGLQLKVAAKQLNLSPETVKSHYKHVRFKLGAKTIAQAVGIAVSRGII